jgi:hypothetical protein
MRALDRLFLICPGARIGNASECRRYDFVPDGFQTLDQSIYALSTGRCRAGARAGILVGLLGFGAPVALAMSILQMGVPAVRAEEIDFSPYRHAADYCRGDVAHPMVLSANQKILCFDGYVSPMQALSLTRKLEPGGLFVVRGYGGDDVQTMALAEELAERNAIVVVYDHCFSACASYLLIASSKAIVLKDALVAWQPLGVERGDCLQFVAALDKGPARYDVEKCPQPLARVGEAGQVYKSKQLFFEKRLILSTKHIQEVSMRSTRWQRDYICFTE